MVVLVDGDVLETADRSSWCLPGFLVELLGHPAVVCYRYADDGPPAHLERTLSPAGEEFVPGWVIRSPERSPAAPFAERGGWDVWYAHDGRLVCTGISDEREELAALDQSTGVYQDCSDASAAMQRRLDALVVGVAEVVNADLVITDREYLHAVEWEVSSTVTVCRPAEALTLVALYLRSRGHYLASLGQGRFGVQQTIFFDYAIIDLLPASRRWLNGCAQTANSGGFGSLYLLAQTLFRKVSRALRDRDRFYIALSKPANRDAGEEVLAALDSVLQSLMDALDVSARVANRVLGISAKKRDVGWHKVWLKKVAVKAEDLASLVYPGTEGRDALAILVELRNCAHGESLRPVGGAVSKGGVADLRRWDRIYAGISLREADREKLHAAFETLGGEAQWGVLPPVEAERFVVDPAMLLEELLPRLMQLINSIMDRTPVERLCPGASASVFAEGGEDVAGFFENMRPSIRWQLALGPSHQCGTTESVSA